MDVAEAVCSENKSLFENKSLSRRATVRLVEEMNGCLPIQLNDEECRLLGCGAV
jgi:hypothetical protein